MIDFPLAAPSTPAVESPLIEVEGLSFRYPEAARPAVDGLGFRVERGSYLAIVGPNGSGKTSLLRLLNGLLSPSAGRVRVLGLDPASPAERYRARAALAMVFQSPPDQIVASVVEEDVAFGPRNLGLPREEVALRVEEALRAVGLWEERTRPSSALSAGQQQRLALAGALAMRPACVAFDEATAMLDPAARRSVLELMDRLRAEGRAVLHVTHDMAEAARADRVLVLREGRIAFDGSPEALFGSPASGEGGASAEPPALRLGIGLPPFGRLAAALGLPARARETPKELARRLAAALPRRETAAPPRAAPASSESELGAPEASGPPVPRGAEALFVIEEASHAYLRGTNREARGLEGLSLRVARGESLAFVGRTGSGKSTALQLLDALLAPHGGRVMAFGAPTTEKGRDLRALRMAAPLAVQRPESALFETYAADDVAFGPRNLGLTGPALVARVAEAMEAVGLPYATFRDRPVRALSGGEKRRLALAGVVAMGSPALLLDEPAAALDPAAREAILGAIADLGGEGRTLVRATHSMEEAAACDRIAVFSGGGLVAEGPPARIFYEDYDPAWELERPPLVELCLELRALGVPVAGSPLDAAGLAAGLALGRAGAAEGAAEGGAR